MTFAPTGGTATIAVSVNADGGTPIGDGDSPGAIGIEWVGIGPAIGGIGGAGMGGAAIPGAPEPKGAGTIVVADIADPACGGIAATARPGLPGAWVSVGPIGPGRTTATPAACDARGPPGPVPVGPPPGMTGRLGPPPGMTGRLGPPPGVTGPLGAPPGITGPLGPPPGGRTG